MLTFSLFSLPMSSSRRMSNMFCTLESVENVVLSYREFKRNLHQLLIQTCSSHTNALGYFFFSKSIWQFISSTDSVAEFIILKWLLCSNKATCPVALEILFSLLQKTYS